MQEEREITSGLQSPKRAAALQKETQEEEDTENRKFEKRSFYSIEPAKKAKPAAHSGGDPSHRSSI